MDFSPISNSTTATASASASKSTRSSEKAVENKAAESKAAENTTAKDGVIYEKDSAAKNSTTKTTQKKSNASIIAQLKKDAEERTAQLQSIVEKMMTKQGSAVGTADSMWSFLAKGNYTVDAATKAQAQADIAEDGYWGVEQTSDRILDFAKALAGDDPDKADEMIAAFQKGFKQATKAWGKELPDISQRTYDAVMKKFDDWKNSTDSVAEKTAGTEA